MFDELSTYPVISPSRFIEDQLEARVWSVEDLASKSKLSVFVINEILNNEQPITYKIAKALGKGFNINPEFFNNLQGSYDREQECRQINCFDDLEEGIILEGLNFD